MLLKDDIRNHGSGNIGATNVGRVIGWKWGGLVLILDALKGLLPTLLAMQQADQHFPALHWHLPVAAGISAILGHMYPIYLRLRGGKGVATALGVVLVIAPKSVLIAFVVFAVVAATSKMIALASMLAATVFGVTQMWMLRDHALDSDKWSLTAFSIAIPLLIIWRHRSNIARIIKGTEPAVSKSASSETRAESQDSDSDKSQPE